MQKKIIIAIILSVIVISAGLGIIGYVAVNESINNSLKHRRTLAGIIASNMDLLLERNLNRLYDISLSGTVDFSDNNWEPEKKVIQTAYQYSIFTDGIFLMDKTGNKLLSYPPSFESRKNLIHIFPYVSKIIQDGKPFISEIYTVGPVRKLIYAMVPLKNRNGDTIGVAGGEIDPTNLRFNEIITAVPAGLETYVEIVDRRGVVIASNNPQRIFACNDHNKFLEKLISIKKPEISTCYRCHAGKGSQPGTSGGRSKDILAFAPLEMANWGVCIIQPEGEVFAPTKKLRKTFLIFSLGSIGIALIVAIGMSRGIVKPVHELIEASQNIAEGDMSKSIEFGGKDEIGILSSSFEIMRLKLSDSLEGLHKNNVELEQRVIERTKQIREGQKKVENLLKRIISAQEDERRRIARGLHDETLQSLSALLMKVDMCKTYPEYLTINRIEEMRKIILMTLDGIRNIIQNLRPAILDDLGLEASIRWLLDKHLTEKGIRYFLNFSGAEGIRLTSREGIRLTSRIETALFRIIQEAVVNISKHADAENVFVILKYLDDYVDVHIEDDGEGFDVPSALKRTEDGRGLGMMGMRERANLLGGGLQICSAPGQGTRLTLWIPYE